MTEKTSNLPLIFGVTSGVALFGLTLFTVIAIYRHRLPRCLRFVLVGLCVVGTTGLSAFLLSHYGLFTRAPTLALGDQLLLAPYTDADLDSRLLQLFCHSLRISSDRPGLTVWTAAVSPNRVSGRVYTLLLPLASSLSRSFACCFCKRKKGGLLFEFTRLQKKVGSACVRACVLPEAGHFHQSPDKDARGSRKKLNSNAAREKQQQQQQQQQRQQQQQGTPTRLRNKHRDAHRLTVKSAPKGTQMAIYAHDRNWREWETAGLQQEAHETCCAWWQLRPLQPTISVKIETSGLHHLVLRGSPAEVGSVVKVTFNRSIFEAAVCDPVVCDAMYVNSCRVDTFERPNILEVRVAEGSENEFDLLQVYIACEHKGWAITLFSSIIPFGILIIVCLITWCREHRRFKRSRMSAASPIYAYPRDQSDRTACVKHDVDFV
ncbi:unnamed protein product [Hydatigera taeniaeformis]|uniref:DUF5730 domain-containing protein n=1 Tax=Hydatigena taeniaeformis TaxID=6205 RepID=A0A158REW1_HYDTA|nr:unnamed protein product [Hydatigera taeniaeformis]